MPRIVLSWLFGVAFFPAVILWSWPPPLHGFPVKVTVPLQELRPRIDEMAETLLNCRRLPGLSLAVVRVPTGVKRSSRTGRVRAKSPEIFTAGYGVVDVTNKRPVTIDSRFCIATLTQSFTAAVLLQLLKENGTYNVDTPVRNILGREFVLSDPDLTHNTTIGDILSQRVGLAPYFGGFMLGYNMTRPDIIRRLRYIPSVQPFRQSFVPNPFLYVLAGHIIEKMNATSWERVIIQRIFKPLRMNATTFADRVPNWAAHFALPHVLRKGILTPTLPKISGNILRPVGPAGSICSTARDMAEWLIVHLRKGKSSRNETILHHDIIKQLFHSHNRHYPATERTEFPVNDSTTSYNFAWLSGKYKGHKRVFLSGYANSYSAFITIYPELGLGIYTATNGPSPAAADSAFRVLHHYITDLATGSDLWLNVSTACSYPRPWSQKENRACPLAVQENMFEALDVIGDTTLTYPPNDTETTMEMEMTTASDLFENATEFTTTNDNTEFTEETDVVSEATEITTEFSNILWKKERKTTTQDILLDQELLRNANKSENELHNTIINKNSKESSLSNDILVTEIPHTIQHDETTGEFFSEMTSTIDMMSSEVISVENAMESTSAESTTVPPFTGQSEVLYESSVSDIKLSSHLPFTTDSENYITSTESSSRHRNPTIGSKISFNSLIPDSKFAASTVKNRWQEPASTTFPSDLLKSSVRLKSAESSVKPMKLNETKSTSRKRITTVQSPTRKRLTTTQSPKTTKITALDSAETISGNDTLSFDSVRIPSVTQSSHTSVNVATSHKLGHSSVTGHQVHTNFLTWATTDSHSDVSDEPKTININQSANLTKITKENLFSMTAVTSSPTTEVSEMLDETSDDTTIPETFTPFLETTTPFAVTTKHSKPKTTRTFSVDYESPLYDLEEVQSSFQDSIPTEISEIVTKQRTKPPSTPKSSQVKENDYEDTSQDVEPALLEMVTVESVRIPTTNQKPLSTIITTSLGSSKQSKGRTQVTASMKSELTSRNKLKPTTQPTAVETDSVTFRRTPSSTNLSRISGKHESSTQSIRNRNRISNKTTKALHTSLESLGNLTTQKSMLNFNDFATKVKILTSEPKIRNSSLTKVSRRPSQVIRIKNASSIKPNNNKMNSTQREKPVSQSKLANKTSTPLPINDDFSSDYESTEEDKLEITNTGIRLDLLKETPVLMEKTPITKITTRPSLKTISISQSSFQTGIPTRSHLNNGDTTSFGAAVLDTSTKHRTSPSPTFIDVLRKDNTPFPFPFPTIWTERDSFSKNHPTTIFNSPPKPVINTTEILRDFFSTNPLSKTDKFYPTTYRPNIHNTFSTHIHPTTFRPPVINFAQTTNVAMGFSPSKIKSSKLKNVQNDRLSSLQEYHRIGITREADPYERLGLDMYDYGSPISTLEEMERLADSSVSMDELTEKPNAFASKELNFNFGGQIVNYFTHLTTPEVVSGSVKNGHQLPFNPVSDNMKEPTRKVKEDTLTTKQSSLATNKRHSSQVRSFSTPDVVATWPLYVTPATIESLQISKFPQMSSLKSKAFTSVSPVSSTYDASSNEPLSSVDFPGFTSITKKESEAVPKTDRIWTTMNTSDDSEEIQSNIGDILTYSTFSSEKMTNDNNLFSLPMSTSRSLSSSSQLSHPSSSSSSKSSSLFQSTLPSPTLLSVESRKPTLTTKPFLTVTTEKTKTVSVDPTSPPSQQTTVAQVFTKKASSQEISITSRSPVSKQERGSKLIIPSRRRLSNRRRPIPSQLQKSSTDRAIQETFKEPTISKSISPTTSVPLTTFVSKEIQDAIMETLIHFGVRLPHERQRRSGLRILRRRRRPRQVTPNPFPEYVGRYGHEFFGNIRVFFNQSSKTLQMNYGLYGRAQLFPLCLLNGTEFSETNGASCHQLPSAFSMRFFGALWYESESDYYKRLWTSNSECSPLTVYFNSTRADGKPNILTVPFFEPKLPPHFVKNAKLAEAVVNAPPHYIGG